MALDDAALRKELSSHVDMVPLPVVTKMEEADKILDDYIQQGAAANSIRLQAPREQPAPTGVNSYMKIGKSWLGGWLY